LGDALGGVKGIKDVSASQSEKRDAKKRGRKVWPGGNRPATPRGGGGTFGKTRNSPVRA